VCVNCKCFRKPSWYCKYYYSEEYN
jgi:hypothetical protein